MRFGKEISCSDAKSATPCISQELLEFSRAVLVALPHVLGTWLQATKEFKALEVAVKLGRRPAAETLSRPVTSR